jgi:hypothetical protein
MDKIELGKYRAELIAERQTKLDAVHQAYKRKLAALDVLLEEDENSASKNGTSNGTHQPLNAPPPGVKAESLVDAVREAIRELSGSRPGGRFGSPNILQYIKKEYPRMNILPADISNRLWLMRRDGIIEVVEQGGGRKPSIYRRVEQSNAAKETASEPNQ